KFLERGRRTFGPDRFGQGWHAEFSPNAADSASGARSQRAPGASRCRDGKGVATRTGRGWFVAQSQAHHRGFSSVGAVVPQARAGVRVRGPERPEDVGGAGCDLLACLLLVPRV